MEGIGKAAIEEFNKSINSVSQGFEARLQEKAKDHAIPFKSDVQAKLPPGLNLGADGRNLGVGEKAEQPPVTKTERKREWALTLLRLKRKTDPTTQNGTNTGSVENKWVGSERLVG